MKKVIENFVPMEIDEICWRYSRGTDTLSITRERLVFLTKFSKKIRENKYCYVQFMIKDSFLIFSFSEKKISNSMKVSNTGKIYSVSFPVIARVLSNKIKEFDCSGKRYSYEIEHLEENVYFVDISKSKNKIKK